MIEGVVERGEKTSRGYFFFNENHNCSRNMMECYYIIFCFFSAGCSLGFLFFMCFIALQSNFSRNNIMRIALYAVLKHEARGARAQVRFYKAPSVDRREGSTNLSDYTCKYFSLRKNYCLFSMLLSAVCAEIMATGNDRITGGYPNQATVLAPLHD